MLQCSTPEHLSTHDRAILDSLFRGSINYSQDYLATFRTYSSQPRVKCLKLQALESFNKNDFDGSMKLLNEAMMEDMNDPSIYLNSAIVQVSMSSNASLQEAIDMLTTAITLDTDIVISRSAYSIRSILYKSLGEGDKAREDMIMAAKMGDKMARDKLRMDNPYAAMCDEVLKGAMAKYRKE